MKTQRQAKILEIVTTRDVETQEQLLQELQDAGYCSTQATISRDIKELRIVKELTSFGRYRYTTSAKEVSGTFSTRLNTIFRECVTGFDYAQNIIIIRTLPGLASAAGSAIDAMNMSVVVILILKQVKKSTVIHVIHGKLIKLKLVQFIQSQLVLVANIKMLSGAMLMDMLQKVLEVLLIIN